jgi:hypothetical protein
MGRKSGQTVGGYHPQIHKMQWVMFQRELVRDQEVKMLNKKKMRGAYWTQRCANAMDWLRTIDAQNWENWFYNDQNVPADASWRAMAQLCEARTLELTGATQNMRAKAVRGIFIWQDALVFFVYSKEVSKTPLYVIEFETFEAAQAFINGLPHNNLGYGFVLDIIPAPKVEDNPGPQTQALLLTKAALAIGDI